jgi:hypothetical protein
MKITKTKLKEIIKEEVVADQALLDAIQSLAGRIEGLDVSIDYLASAFLGVSAGSIGVTQKALGRWAHIPKVKFGTAATPARGNDLKEMKKIIKEEIEKMIVEGESDYLSNIYKWCPADTECPPESKKTKWWKGK